MSDRHRIARSIEQLKKKSPPSSAYKEAVRSIESNIQLSITACDKRRASIPKNISYPEQLPVSGHSAEIVELLKQQQVLIVAGDTGSGKTTQLPKMCLQAGFGRLGLIGHTQPRRLAASSVADRIAEELGAKVGGGVGFQIRFDDRSSEQSYLKLMTDGILLAEIQQDKFLNKYEVLIIDEAHERSLNIDFLLGYLKTLLRRRKDLKLIITSATIDVDKFSRHFDKAPVVSVSGRTFPVETRYSPLAKSADAQVDDDLQVNGIIDAIKEIREIKGASSSSKKAQGDVLIFFASEREIREAAMKLRKQRFPETEILPLYGRLRHSEQLKIFRPHKGRRLVLATNVAETSLTVPGIHYVIDTGLARISRYSLQSKVQRLPIEAISQASANQRKGRCGRIADGVCIRLYSEDDFNKRGEFTDPEILRTNLAAVILRMKSLKLGDIENFPFLEPPEQKAINEGVKLLIELNALNPARELTDCGRALAKLPVDPKYGRMLLIAQQQSCLREMLIIVSALTIQDPREISAENRQQAMEALMEFNHADSDFLSFVKLWDHYEKLRQDNSQGQLKRYCKTHFLSYMRMREWREVHRQLLLGCQHLGFKINREPASYAAVHKSIISGSLNQIAQWQESRNYLGNRNRKFSLFSTSVLATQKTKWIVSGELIETSQTFASMAAKIQPQWVVDMALHLVKRTYFEPHWSKKRQETVVYEKVHLYGLAIIEKSLVSYENIDPVNSREIFIREALLADQLDDAAGFLQHNRKLLAELEKQEEKLRRPDIIVAEKDIRAFYEASLPENIHSSSELKSWLKKNGRKAVESLQMSREKLIRSPDALDKVHAFPDATAVKKNNLLIDYVFDPGSRVDGASIEVPLAMLNQVAQADLDWAVPGVIRDRCIALIKGLPKAQRKKFIPVSSFVDEVLPQMSKADGDLIDSLIAQIRNRKRIALSRTDFEVIDLPEHLQLKIRIVDEAKAEIAYGKNLMALKKDLTSKIPRSNEEAGQTASASNKVHQIEVSGLSDWDFDELPQSLDIEGEFILTRYPALIDRGETVDLTLLADKQTAFSQSRQGVAKLFMLRSVQQRNMLRKKFKKLQQSLALLLPKNQVTIDQTALEICYDSAFNLSNGLPRSKAAFEKSLIEGKSRILGIADQLERLIRLSMQERWEILQLITKFSSTGVVYLKEDIESQLNQLLHEDFLLEAGLSWFTEYPRYFKAIRVRLEKVPHLGTRDEADTELLASYWRRYRDIQEKLGGGETIELQQLRWMIEEFRVSLFAQNLGTRISVSPRRIDKQIEKLLATPSNRHDF